MAGRLTTTIKNGSANKWINLMDLLLQDRHETPSTAPDSSADILMKRRPVIRLGVIAMGFLVGVFVLQHSSAAVFDLGADFSSIENPNGRWQYGYSATLSLATNEFRLMGLAATNYPISFWHPWSTNNSGDGYYPYVACNPSTNTLTDPTSGWAARADEVAMEASSSGQYSMVRFVAAQAGVYRLEAAFAGIHFRLSSTDVHILINTTPIFAADIDGYC